jgi:hypothetical protein
MTRLATLALALLLAAGAAAQPADPCKNNNTMVDIARCVQDENVRRAQRNDPESVDIWRACSTESFADAADKGRITYEQFFGVAGSILENCQKEADQRRAQRLEERRVQAQERAAAAADMAARVEAQKLCLRLTGRLCPVPSQ